MTQESFDPERRRALRLALYGAAAAPFAGALLTDTAWAAKVDPSSTMAKALNYTKHSTKKGEDCGNCRFYQGSGDYAPCTIFGGKKVPATGWCKSWTAAPA